MVAVDVEGTKNDDIGGAFVCGGVLDVEEAVGAGEVGGERGQRQVDLAEDCGVVSIVEDNKLAQHQERNEADRLVRFHGLLPGVVREGGDEEP